MNPRVIAVRALFLAACISLQNPAEAKEKRDYYSTTIEQLTIEGELPKGATEFRGTDEFIIKRPKLQVAGGGEGYVEYQKFWHNESKDFHENKVVISVPLGDLVRGKLIWPTADKQIVAIPFVYKGNVGGDDARIEFNKLKAEYYQPLAELDVPGGAWFQYQYNTASRAAGTGDPADPERRRPRSERGSAIEEFIEIFSGARAIRENLQLDRRLAEESASDKTLDIHKIEGIRTRSFDFASLIRESKPDLDALASIIPADQHAAFFPSFQKMIDLLDAADRNSMALMHWIESHAGDTSAVARYKKQLCIETTELARLLGPSVIQSVAITGSDPYLRMGSDVAVLFETKTPLVLSAYMGTRYSSAAHSGAKFESGTLDGALYVSVRDPERSICSYTCVVRDSIVIVTNSLVQLKQLIATSMGAPALAAAPEYVYFRDHYKKGGADESVFLVLTDATIRRWLSPRWRIADMRRMRALAAMLQIQTEHVREIIQGTVPRGPLDDPAAAWLGPLEMGPDGVRSKLYGSLSFMTPICELDIDKVTKREQSVYVQLRDHYEEGLRDFFDPIAVRLALGADRAALDVTVIPLILGSEYRMMTGLTQGTQLAAGVGDPHDDTIIQFAIAFKPENLLPGMLDELSQSSKSDSRIVDWLGNYLSIFCDQDSIFDEMKRDPDLKQNSLRYYLRGPIGLIVGVRDGASLDLFLNALIEREKELKEEGAKSEKIVYGNFKYLRITLPKPHMPEFGDGKNFAIYVANADEFAVVTFREDVLKRVLDRETGRKAKIASGAPAAPRPWLGENVTLRAQGKFLELIDMAARIESRDGIGHESFNNLPILNDWKRLHPAEDPVAMYEKIYKTRPICPGGGEYVWNEKWQTMESTVCGHPGEPKPVRAIPQSIVDIKNMEFGLTFENGGLRATAELIYK
ncbi:MAG: hypothetical protein HY286_14475 [Planctomycetes bacterium]|nr:hypothetical protein [Planctomycetota bacterium]